MEYDTEWVCTYVATPSLMYSDSRVTPMCALRTFLETGLQSSSRALLEGGRSYDVSLAIRYPLVHTHAHAHTHAHMHARTHIHTT